MPNDLLVTTTDILGIEVAKDYSGASGIYVDNVNNIISITGDVGKEYNGIEPIVVNNEENLISANSAPIGVQEPLYFVQDDDEAVIIGFSGEYVTPSDIAGKMDTSAFESWQQGQYTNDLTAINEKINEVSSNIPSIEGLATEQLVEETSAAIVSQIPSTAGLATETYVQEQTSAKASKSDLETVSGDIVNLIPDVSNYYTKNETSGAEQLAEAFANIPGGEGDEEVNALVHSNSATWNEVSSKLDESTFQEASGLFLTAVPQEYVTESDIPNFISAKLDTDAFADVSGTFLTAHQSLEGYATEQFVEDTSASITALIPTDYYPNSNPSGFISGVDLSNYYQKNETSSKEEISAAIAAIPLGDVEVNQAVHTNSATWNTVTDKLDTTSFSEVSGTFLTAHQSLDGYATETLVEETSGAITSLIPTDYYPDSNPSGFISEVPNTYLQNTDLTIVDNKVTEISGVPLSAGDEFPVSADEAIQYVQTNSGTIDNTVTSYQTNSGTFLTAHQSISAEEWNDCYDNVNTNSGVWGGSALPISAGPGIKVNLVDNTLVFSNDETVLWEDNTDPAEGINGTKSINETVSNFENIDVYFWRCSDHSQTYRYYQINRVPVMSGSSNFATFWQESTAWFKMFLRISGTTASFREGHYTNAGLTDSLTETNMYSQGNIFKIVGINRIGG